MSRANADIMLLVAKVEDHLAMVHDTVNKLRAICEPEIAGIGKSRSRVAHRPTPKQIARVLTAEIAVIGRSRSSPDIELRWAISVEMFMPELEEKL